MDKTEQKIKENEKKCKEKFLEDYFSICIEHGFCVDWKWNEWEGMPMLCIDDTPGQTTFMNVWGAYKKELKESLNERP